MCSCNDSIHWHKFRRVQPAWNADYDERAGQDPFNKLVHDEWWLDSASSFMMTIKTALVSLIGHYFMEPWKFGNLLISWVSMETHGKPVYPNIHDHAWRWWLLSWRTELGLKCLWLELFDDLRCPLAHFLAYFRLWANVKHTRIGDIHSWACRRRMGLCPNNIILIHLLGWYFYCGILSDSIPSSCSLSKFKL